MSEQSTSAREMTTLQRWRSRFMLEVWHWRLSKWLPRLVWPGDEIDVRVTFSRDKLGQDDPFRALFSGRLHDAEVALHDAGISFDTGMGFGGRDWEWDFSLKGPISVKFRRRAKHPERRKERPRPKLIFTRQKTAE